MTNLVVLRGRLNRPPEERLLPSGTRLATFDLTVPAPAPAHARAPVATRRADAVPLSWFDPPAWVADLGVGTELLVVGRVRRRFFQGNGLQSRTEVVVDHAAPARHTVRSAAVVKRALSVIGGLADSPDDDGSGA
jgi:single-stranded DNA-binding protein